ncbi:MAG TPA: hypothetical protein VFD16_03140 [Candidatus Saccharimonadales bacterium]|nr:hypothetical protein [Candidatus Saccharimonadales bacterium]
MKKVFLILAVAISFGLAISSCGNKKAANSQATTTVAMNPYVTYQLQVEALTTEIGNLKAENARLQAELNCCESKLPASKRTKTTVKKTTATAPKATTPVVTKSAIIPTKPTPVPGTPSNANLDGLRENGIISFCVMVNGDGGLHFPQKALDKGVTFTSIETNPSNDGHNWIVEPVEYYEGDYGLIVDGIFFVDNAMLAKVLEGEAITVTSVMIKAPFTKWKATEMYLEDGFWKFNALKR